MEKVRQFSILYFGLFLATSTVFFVVAGVPINHHDLQNLTFKSDTWERIVTLKPDEFYARWKNSEPDVHGQRWILMEVQTKGKGYMSIGFSPDGKMKGADMAIAWIDANGKQNLLDIHGCNRTVDVDEQQDIFLVDMDQSSSGWTTIRFIRRWDTGDSEDDIKITGGAMNLIWAYHDTLQPTFVNGELTVPYHGRENRGSALAIIDQGGIQSQPGNGIVPNLSWKPTGWEEQIALKDDAFYLKWKSSEPDENGDRWILMEARAKKAQGYLSVGFSPDGKMKGSDMAVAWVDEDGNKNLLDLHGCNRTVDVDEPNEQDFHLVEMYQNENWTTVQFLRKWNTGHDEDLKIRAGAMHIIWAYHETVRPIFANGNLTMAYHGPVNRGSSLVIIERSETLPRISWKPSGWERKLTLKEDAFTVAWKNSEAEVNSNTKDGDRWILMEAKAKAKGYLSVGFSNDGKMNGADMAIAWIDLDGNKNLLDLHGCNRSVDVDELEEQDFYLLDMYRDEDWTIVQFLRKWDTGHQEDVPIRAQENLYLIWSYHETDRPTFVNGNISVPYHGPENRGSELVVFDEDKSDSESEYPGVGNGNQRTKDSSNSKNWDQEHILKENEFIVRWKNSEPEGGNRGQRWILMQILAKATGYVSLGFSLDGNPRTGDKVIAWIDANGTQHLVDVHSVNKSQVVDQVQNYQLAKMSENGNWTTVSFLRRWDTGDAEDDVQITDGSMNLVWMYNAIDKPTFLENGDILARCRGNRGIKSVVMAQEEIPVDLEVDEENQGDASSRQRRHQPFDSSDGTGNVGLTTSNFGPDVVGLIHLLGSFI